MKKYIYVVIVLIVISLSIVMIYMDNKKEDTNILKVQNISENIEEKNEFSIVSTFKEENSERYKNYKINHSDLDNNEIVKNVNLDLDYNFYENIHDAINLNTNLILTNKYYKLDKDYVPNNLVEVDIYYASGYGIYADEEAYNHFKDLCNAANVVNLSIKTISAYRSYSYQEALYNGYLKQDSQEVVDTYSARAGHSEHQTGLAFDLYNTKVSYINFGDTDEYIWLKDNAHLYGFIIRYTTENEYITGYKNEPWHIRYVGIDEATYIYNNNITLEEYLLNR